MPLIELQWGLRSEKTNGIMGFQKKGDVGGFHYATSLTTAWCFICCEDCVSR